MEKKNMFICITWSWEKRVRLSEERVKEVALYVCDGWLYILKKKRNKIKSVMKMKYYAMVVLWETIK